MREITMIEFCNPTLSIQSLHILIIKLIIDLFLEVVLLTLLNFKLAKF